MNSYVIQKLTIRIMAMKLIIVTAATRNYLIKHEIREIAPLPHCTFQTGLQRIQKMSVFGVQLAVARPMT